MPETELSPKDQLTLKLKSQTKGILNRIKTVLKGINKNYEFEDFKGDVGFYLSIAGKQTAVVEFTQQFGLYTNRIEFTVNTHSPIMVRVREERELFSAVEQMDILIQGFLAKYAEVGSNLYEDRKARMKEILNKAYDEEAKRSQEEEQ